MTLEQKAKFHWQAWGSDWAQYTQCHGCKEMHYCRAKSKNGRWLCLDCWDQKR